MKDCGAAQGDTGCGRVQRLRMVQGSTKGAIMMFAYRLVRLIETNADALAAGLENKVANSPSLGAFRDIPANQLRERVYGIYRHLGEWLLGENQAKIEQRYREIGAQRAMQNVPLAEVILAIVLTKENLWEFLKSEAAAERAMEIMGELELLQMLERFFDHALYYAAVGYQEQVERQKPQGHQVVAV
jgi:hypothetical protein